LLHFHEGILPRITRIKTETNANRGLQIPDCGKVLSIFP
jgi:hypothetical protein